MSARGVLRVIENGHLGFHCPGCGHSHVVRVEDDGTPSEFCLPGLWSFNDDYDRPTFSPSIHATWGGKKPQPTPENPEPKALVKVCHSFVTDGQIQFLGDCTHALVGLTVPLVPCIGEQFE